MVDTHNRNPYKERNHEEIREKAMTIINEYLTSNRIKKALRLIQYLGDDHGYLKSNGIDMRLVNHYNTPNMEDLANRCEAAGMTGSKGAKNYNINKLRFFKNIPDGIEILIDYVDVTALRIMDIPTEIIYESIYRELPELFEE